MDVAVAVTVAVAVDVAVDVVVDVAVDVSVFPGKGYACTWAGVAISQSISSNANKSIAKQSTSAVPLETIFDRFSFVFIFTFSNHRPPARFP